MNAINMPVDPITDDRLSAKARGIYAWMLWALKTGKTVNLKAATDAGLGGANAVRSGFAELEEKGYLTRSRVRDERGILGEAVYELYSNPKNT